LGWRASDEEATRQAERGWALRLGQERRLQAYFSGMVNIAQII